jgi:GNAT superfamily N-acetyltransferase
LINLHAAWAAALGNNRPMTRPVILVRPCETAGDLALAAALFREYAASLPFPLDYQGFDAELATLPGKYAPPNGVILLAGTPEGVPIGCIALRPLAPSFGDPTPVCEMKRMYVKPGFRGMGAGRLLAECLLSHARAAGYALMKLDTESEFTEALTLYRSLGFVECPRYNDDPMPGTLWMSLKL